MRRSGQTLLHVISPLIIGLLIYFFFRPDVWFMKLLAERDPVINPSQMSGWQKIFIFSGPDFCWSYSFSSALFIWHNHQHKRIGFFSVFVLVLITGAELIQQMSSFGFTFDWWDMIAAFVAFILSAGLNNTYGKK